MRIARCSFVLALLLAPLPAQIGGTGADGPLTPTSNLTLNTDANKGVFNYTDIVIPVGVTVTLTGGNAALLRATGNVVIDGVLEVAPGHCMHGMEWSPGYVGAYAEHVERYDPEFAHLTVGGTRSDCGTFGYGGGFLEVSAFGSVLVTGTVRANASGGFWCNGWRHGSGGTVVVRTLQPVVLAASGSLQALRGDGHPNGLIRIETAAPPTLIGTVQPAPKLSTPQRLLPRMWSMSRLSPFVLTQSDAAGVLTSSPVVAEPFGVATTLRGARWVTFPAANRIHPYGRGGADLLPNRTWGTGGTPRGIAADRFGQLWVACGVGQLHRHNSWGVSTLNVALAGNPYGVAVDANDKVWVTCQSANTLHCVRQDGTIAGSYTVGVGPRGIAVDGNNNVWVTLTGGPGAAQGAVAKIDQQGNVLFTVPVDKLPLGIACDAQNRAWVACEGDLISAGNRVFRIAADGLQVDAFPVGTAPTSVAIGGDGAVWIVNSGNFVEPTSGMQQLNPTTGAPVSSHALPNLSIAFGDATGYQACLVYDKYGDVDGDGEPNLQEMSFLGDPFDPTRLSQPANRVISSVTPVAGMMAGGTQLTIRGGPFTYTWGTTVTVNGVPATNVQVVAVDTITCTTGPIAQQGRGDVVVTDPAGAVTAAQAFRYSNATLSATPANGVVQVGSGFTLNVRSHPYTPFWLVAANGVGSHAIFGITLELPTPVWTILDPYAFPITITTNATGQASLGLSVPANPALVGLQFSFLSAVVDPACFICASNGVVVTISN